MENPYCISGSFWLGLLVQSPSTYTYPHELTEPRLDCSDGRFDLHSRLPADHCDLTSFETDQEVQLEDLLFIGGPVLDFLLENPHEFLAGNCRIRRQSVAIWNMVLRQAWDWSVIA
jgi:hypothetical protein